LLWIELCFEYSCHDLGIVCKTQNATGLDYLKEALVAF
jgi:hypothetical protein